MEKNKIFLIGAIVVIIAITSYFALYGGNEKIYDETYYGNILVNKGDTFKIGLNSNPSTGYQWNADFDESLLELVNVSYEADKPQTTGSGGIEIFEFKAIGKNTETTINFAYYRSWESVPPIDEISFTIKIK